MIEYTGKILLDDKWHSSYLLGYAGYEWVSAAYRTFAPDYFCNRNEALLHYRVVRLYIKEEYPVLYGWLGETQTPFGGWLGDTESGHDSAMFYPIKLLLDPGSIQETAFRLCFSVKAMSL